MQQIIINLLCRFLFLPRIRRLERKIGYRLSFPDIPPRFIPSIVSWPMTDLWQRYGLAVEAGMNYWTIGRVEDGVSSRYDRNAPEYQAWLGGYLVKLAPGQSWTPEYHVKLALADQESWLKNHGDPEPLANADNWTFKRIGEVRNGAHVGTLYETGGLTHSDVGDTYDRSQPYFNRASMVMASLMNALRPGLGIRASMMRPRIVADRYETLELRVYFAIFELEGNAHAVLYGNGALVPQADGKVIDTLPVIAEDLLRTIRACEIVRA